MTKVCGIPWDTDYTRMPYTLWAAFRQIVDQSLRVG